MSDAPLNLNIGSIPFRKGTWLSLQQGSVIKTLAKFRDKESVDLFMQVMVKAQKDGIKVNG
jgi:hypothetical protein